MKRQERPDCDEVGSSQGQDWESWFAPGPGASPCPAPAGDIRAAERRGPVLLTSEAATSEVPQGADLPGAAAEGLAEQEPRARAGAALRAVVADDAVTLLETEKARGAGASAWPPGPGCPFAPALPPPPRGLPLPARTW